MIEKYEQAIKETFKYLNDCIAEHFKQDRVTQLMSLGIDKCYVIEKQMAQRGFVVRAMYLCHCLEAITVYPREDSLPIHIWKNKYVIELTTRDDANIRCVEQIANDGEIGSMIYVQNDEFNPYLIKRFPKCPTK